MSLLRLTRATFEVLQLSNAQTSFEICPARGALVTDFKVGGEAVLFLDAATFADPAKSVRGGVPLLFPIAGPAPEGSPLSQHGFARTQAWSEIAVDAEHVTLRLASSAATREKFPYDFSVDFTLYLAGAELRLEWVIRNASPTTAMPLQFGLHPYFSVPVEAKAAARVDSSATKSWNNITKAFAPVTTLPSFGGDEIDLHLLDHAEPGTTIHRGAAQKPIRLRWSTTFHTLVLWTQPGKPFVCVEPWSCPSLPARAGAGLPMLGPGATETYMLSISL